jgi:hypothetical protein
MGTSVSRNAKKKRLDVLRVSALKFVDIRTSSKRGGTKLQ